MRGGWAAIVLLPLIACSGPGSPSGSTGTPNPTLAASPSPTSSPAPTLSGSTVGPIDFKCVLPVYGIGSDRGAFIAFPTGTLTAAQDGGYYYDRAVSRWLPVYRWQVSPDGLSYAYTEGWSVNPASAPRLHIANAATRTDLRVVQLPDAQPYQVADVTGTAVYLIIAFEGTAPGVWRVDRSTGAMAKVSNGYYLPMGAGWISVVDPRDAHPQRSAFSGAAQPNRVDRRDEAGRRTTWFYAPGYSLSWVEFSGSTALFVNAFRQVSPAAAGTNLYWLVDRPGHATRVRFSPGAVELGSGFGSAIADAHGIWLGASGSLYLVRRTGAIQRVFDSAVYPANGCF